MNTRGSRSTFLEPMALKVFDTGSIIHWSCTRILSSRLDADRTARLAASPPPTATRPRPNRFTEMRRMATSALASPVPASVVPKSLTMTKTPSLTTIALHTASIRTRL